MKKGEVEEIIACLSEERFLFHYFKDRYCLDLLKMELESKGRGKEGLDIGEIQSGPFEKLLQKPIVKKALASAGNRRLTTEHLEMQWPIQVETYLMTLDVWGTGCGRWEQTSRPGSNLVLQLNFSRKHDRRYQTSIRPTNDRPFDYLGHPVHRGDRNTMAWVRIDCSFGTDEALIEEIQTDWLREANWVGNIVKQIADKPERLRRFLDRNGICCDSKGIEEYLSHLTVHQKTWSEAALNAALLFIRSTLGLRKIYYHTHETGRIVKRIGGNEPPVSLYQQLPRKFCFEITDESPDFLKQSSYLRRRLRKVNQPQWFCLPG